MTSIELLANVPLFSDLSPSTLDDLLSRMNKRTYRKNSVILMEHELGDTFFIISGGSVKITRISENGREVIFAMLGEGDFFGEMSLLDEETRSANAIALEDAEVLILKGEEFFSLMEEYPRIAIALSAELARRIRKSDQQIESLSLSDAEHRVGATLLRLAEEFGTVRKGVVRVSNLPYQQDTANMAGTSRETVSRTMKMLHEKGMTARRGRALSIFDYARFKRNFA